MTAIQSDAARKAHARLKRTVTVELPAQDAKMTAEILTHLGVDDRQVLHVSPTIRASYRRAAAAIRTAVETQ